MMAAVDGFMFLFAWSACVEVTFPDQKKKELVICSAKVPSLSRLPFWSILSLLPTRFTAILSITSPVDILVPWKAS